MAQLARAGRRVRAGQPGPARQPPGPPAGAGGAGRLPAPARTVAPVRARVQRRQRPPRAGPCTQPAVRPARPARRAGRRAAAAARAGRRAAGAGARGAPGRGRAGCLCAGSAPDTAVYRPLRGRPLPQKSVAKQGGSCARKPGSEHPRTASEARQHVQRGACASVRFADFLKPSRHCKQRLSFNAEVLTPGMTSWAAFWDGDVSGPQAAPFEYVVARHVLDWAHPRATPGRCQHAR